MKYRDIVLKCGFLIDSIIDINYNEYAPCFISSVTSCNYWNMVYADRGSFAVAAGGGEICISAGQFVLLRPMETSVLRTVNGNSFAAVNFSFKCDCQKLYSVTDRAITCTSEEKGLLSVIMREAQLSFYGTQGDETAVNLTRRSGQPFGAEQIVKNAAEIFFIECLRNNEGKSLSVSPLKNVTDRTAAQICGYLESHVTEPLCVKDICRIFAISPTRLKKLFRSQVGSGVMEYFTECRIDCAKRLIRDGEKSLSETAEYLGFSSAPHFSKRFKAVTGMTPSQYARSVRPARINPNPHMP